jgi:hypothetical protein
LAGLLRTIRTRLLGNGITWLLRNHHEDSREKGGQQKATQAGREGNDTSGQPLFTLCLEGCGEDVGASSRSTRSRKVANNCSSVRFLTEPSRRASTSSLRGRVNVALLSKVHLNIRQVPRLSSCWAHANRDPDCRPSQHRSCHCSGGSVGVARS